MRELSDSSAFRGNTVEYLLRNRQIATQNFAFFVAQNHHLTYRFDDVHSPNVNAGKPALALASLYAQKKVMPPNRNT
jgi:hypothetical protein